MNMKMMSKLILIPKSCILYFIYFFIFSFHTFYFPFPIKEISIIRHVGAGINALMSISDGLGPSIFCRKMEKARPMMDEMDGKVVYFRPESAFSTFDLLVNKVLFPICTSTWRVNNHVSRQEKV